MNKIFMLLKKTGFSVRSIPMSLPLLVTKYSICFPYMLFLIYIYICILEDVSSCAEKEFNFLFCCDKFGDTKISFQGGGSQRSHLGARMSEKGWEQRNWLGDHEA